MNKQFFIIIFFVIVFLSCKNKPNDVYLDAGSTFTKLTLPNGNGKVYLPSGDKETFTLAMFNLDNTIGKYVVSFNANFLEKGTKNENAFLINKDDKNTSANYSYAETEWEDEDYEYLAQDKALEKREFFIPEKRGRFDSNGKILETITAVLAKTCENAIIYIDEIYYNAFSSNALDYFCEHLDKNIFPRTRFFFGIESDVDNNNRVVLLFTSFNKSTIKGYFDTSDFLAPDKNNPNPFNGEISYIAIAEENLKNKILIFNPSNILGIIAHELQHLINFTNKNITDSNMKHAIIKEHTGINEGLSHLSTSLNGYESMNNNIISDFLYNINSATLNISSAMSDEDNLNGRGANYLLVRYLFERKGGASFSFNDKTKVETNGGVEFLQQLVLSPENGFDNLAKTFGNTLSNIFFDWAITLLSGNYSFDLYKYSQPINDPITQDKIGVKLAYKKNINNKVVNFNGPNILQVTKTTEFSILTFGFHMININAPKRASDELWVDFKTKPETTLYVLVKKVTN
jgi:hypothetical protein